MRFAARKAGLETLPAVIVGAEDIEYSDEVKEEIREGNERKSRNFLGHIKKNVGLNQKERKRNKYDPAPNKS